MSKSTFDVYEAVQERILEALDHDLMPWRRPWVSRNGRGGGAVAVHTNLVNKTHYRGINVFLLEVTAALNGYSSPYWLTFNQLKAKNGRLLKINGEDEPGTGQHSTLVVLWKPLNVQDTNDDGSPKVKDGQKVMKRIFMLKHFKVFNVEQTTLEPPVTVEPEPEATEPQPEFNPIDEAEAILANMPQAPPVDYGKGGAYYMPSTDRIGMPDREDFTTPEEFYSTLFHENVHATGHKDRLDRKDAFKGSFGDGNYAREELVAEMGAAMLCGYAGVENNLDQSASYIRHWMSKADYQAAIKQDKKLVVLAAARAQKAADFILGELKENS